jgi:hypothetical protein
MSRRGRRQARRHAQDRRQRLVEEWAEWRDRADRERERREGADLERELKQLAEQPGWRLSG